ncbi:MAG TPA: NADH-quinone oxidoreductase subunit NuoF [Anaerolineales bacterium]|nr:NADH-quinone oxidoreductase subunit NuoF [Anaerolineales bacterium]
MKTIRSMILVSEDEKSNRLGGRELFQSLQAALQEFDLQEEVAISTITDLGRQDALPMVVVYPDAVIYGPVTPADAHFLVEEHLYKGRIVERLLAPAPETSDNASWLSARKGALPAEQRIVLQRAGRIDPESIDEYIVNDGYAALGKALTEMSPADVIAEVEKAGLQGRGGAGFPVGRKWGFVAGAPGNPKYIVCNADESEPGTFKDRLIMEGDPFALVEAITLAGYAIGAQEGYIYIRGEYGLAYQRLKNAIEQAHAYGMLGKNIFNSQFSFDLHVHAGAGAYICGEETALLESLEGKRGEPRSRPPYPTTHGLWGKPTLVNNVESLANVPPIIRNGARWYRTYGTPSSPGTKVYTIMGQINTPGVIEVPMGITLREVIAIYGHGMKPGSTFKLAQTGGSSGSIIPAALQDIPMDFESFRKAGVSLGSGALLICDQTTCIVDLAKVLLQFFRFESCGKCTPCRIGTQWAYETLVHITQGQGQLSDLDSLPKLASQMEMISHCGLGQTAGVPMRDMVKNFRAEVEAHIVQGTCPAGVCPMKAPKGAAKKSKRAAEHQAAQQPAG